MVAYGSYLALILFIWWLTFYCEIRSSPIHFILYEIENVYTHYNLYSTSLKYLLDKIYYKRMCT